MHSILVRDYMLPNPPALSVNANTAQVVDRLLHSGLTGLPVVDDGNTLVGFISEQDCIKEMLNDAFFCEEPPGVRQLMTPEVISVAPTASIVEVAQRMMHEKPKSYPVVSDGTLVGLITRRHVLQALVDNGEDCYLNI